MVSVHPCALTAVWHEIFLRELAFSADSLMVFAHPNAFTAVRMDHVVHVRVWWIMEILKHPACTISWVAQLCRSCLSQGIAT